uniref:BsmI n=1 Tax=Geobacillus stearothermophilus TaxID=1422 RepID=Q8RLN4_GEOSE|nr:BsmI [Geobacillus stearothermophilus]
MNVFRIHGDNIIECERVIDLILSKINPQKVKRGFISLSCPFIEIIFKEGHDYFHWRFDMFPGFNKNTNDRWNSNILDLLSQKGSFLYETPDVIITSLNNGKEEILMAIEFCSALQAGNQAWQRSGRAYSVGRTGYPYIYIVDFVKYELNNSDRSRKNLRFPNPAIPYSYISHSKNTGNFIVQAYFRGEEYQPKYDKKLKFFDETIFAEDDIADYIIAKLQHRDTSNIEQLLINKNLKMVEFLSKNTKNDNNFTYSEWESIYNGTYRITNLPSLGRFKFRKKIAEKSLSGKVKEFNNIVQRYSVGLASSDLPFGVIRKESRNDFINDVCKLYNINDMKIIKELKEDADLIVCMLKGFKPRGDDNRPDRGALPLVAMLAGENAQIFTFIYGPLIKGAINLIDQDINKLAKRNGLWKSFVSLSDFIVLDCPIIGESYNEFRLIINKNNKESILRKTSKQQNILVDPTPNHYQENDVDTVIYSIFKYIVPNCFSGMCNPPGGDWSGLSIIRNGHEFRWLSLPRVSENGKRPDHVIQILDLFEKPLLLSIESKEKPNDLEPKIGVQLIKYIEYLFDFTPSVQRKIAGGNWEFGNKSLVPNDFILLSAGAFIDYDNLTENDYEKIFEVTGCDLLIAIKNQNNPQKWVIKFKPKNTIAEKLVNYIKLNFKSNIFDTGFFHIEG